MQQTTVGGTQQYGAGECRYGATHRCLYFALAIIDHASRYLIGFVFFAAAIGKCSAPAPTLVTLERLMDKAWTPLAFWLFISIEMLVGSFLFFGIQKRMAYGVSAFLMLVFTAYLLFLEHIVRVEGCACGFERLLGSIAGVKPVHRNLVFMIIIAAGAGALALQGRMRGAFTGNRCV